MAVNTTPEGSEVLGKVQGILESDAFQKFIIGVILINAVTIGMETSDRIMASFGPVLKVIDGICLAIFIVEIVAKLVVYRLRFFKDAWNVFDFIIVGIAILPFAEGLSVLRALRILRALRLISMVPQMRLVVQALLTAIPAMGSVIALLSLIFYVSAVMATKLFGEHFDEWFGTIGASLYTLFQIMTLESWSMGIVRPVMAVYPYAWIFFVPFILVITFAVMNLFIAIVVNSMTSVAHEEAEALLEDTATLHKDNVVLHEDQGAILQELKALRSEIAELRAEARKSQPD
ncbi:MAG: ion transporter [Pseudomonadota bacterium]